MTTDPRDPRTPQANRTKDPAFVIHGVANRDRDAFGQDVATLQAASGVELVPVYWGDLGAQEQHIQATLPSRTASKAHPAEGGPGDGPDDGSDIGLRDGGPDDGRSDGSDIGLRDGAPHFPDTSLSFLSPSALLGDGLRAPEPTSGLAIVEAAVREQYASRQHGPDDSGLRDGAAAPVAPDIDDILDCLREEWPSTRWLRHADDPALLSGTGQALADAISDTADLAAEGAGANLDGGHDGLRDASPEDGRLRTLIRRRLRDLDRVAGAAVQAVAGRLNHAVRTRFGPGTTRFLGDVLVYQRHQAKIHARVRETIDAVDPALGRSPDRPVRVIAHSLGGVIAVDMATASVPLWTGSLLTFGSQAAFFHVCDPRGGQLAPYAGAEGVTLPPSLGRWTNLWEPLDMLAFAASKVFRLHDGSTPVDIALPHSASDGLWTHSAYWTLPPLTDIIARAV